jgi:hypothetical protein
MFIEVVAGTDAIPAAAPLIRAYAEYRVFAHLAPVATELQHVRVRVGSRRPNGMMSCAIRAQLRHGAVIHVRRRCRQPTRAIDRAVDRLAEVAISRLDRSRRPRRQSSTSRRRASEGTRTRRRSRQRS